MVEETTHNGYSVGSTPSGLKVVFFRRAHSLVVEQ